MPTESQLQDAALRLRVRERIENGLLAVMVPETIIGGYGSGHVCVACDQPITSDQFEYEVNDYRDGKRLSFHLGCQVAWQIECAKGRRDRQRSLTHRWACTRYVAAAQCPNIYTQRREPRVRPGDLSG